MNIRYQNSSFSSRSVYGEGLSVLSQIVLPPSRSPDHLAAHRWNPICNTGLDLIPIPTLETDPIRPELSTPHPSMHKKTLPNCL